mmetsp:Transcript_39311/g.63766  ORF Transcript_39311/g.63766 Transcript_39311/m.63766 type:complete len:83 (-) Transcript_39311:557-805(-)
MPSLHRRAQSSSVVFQPVRSLQSSNLPAILPTVTHGGLGTDVPKTEVTGFNANIPMLSSQAKHVLSCRKCIIQRALAMSFII